MTCNYVNPYGYEYEARHTCECASVIARGVSRLAVRIIVGLAILITLWLAAGCKSAPVAVPEQPTDQVEVVKAPVKVMVKTFGVHPTVATALYTTFIAAVSSYVTHQINRVRGKGIHDATA